MSHAVHRLALVAACLLAGGCGDRESTTNAGTDVNGRATVRVDHVTDGDTFTTTGGDRIRLVQVDAPELPQGECHATASRDALRELLPDGSRVQVAADRDLDTDDRFGRQLRYVWANGQLVNELLVDGGDAAPYFYRGERGRYAGRLLRAARAARNGRRGAWERCSGASFEPGRAWDTGR